MLPLFSDATTEAAVPYKYDFKRIAEGTDVAAVARHLNLVFVRGRANCPTCQTDGGRDIELVPESNTFKCYSGEPRAGCAYLTGDCIGLYAHIKGVGQYQAAKALTELFGADNRAAPKPEPQKPEGRTEKSQPAPPPRGDKKDAPSFNAAAFSEALAYTPEVAALGISEEVAQRFGIGYCTKPSMRGFVCFPIADKETGEVHYIGWNGSEFKVPKWHTNVVPMRRRA